jgi:hypothetical protein
VDTDINAGWLRGNDEARWVTGQKIDATGGTNI